MNIWRAETDSVETLVLNLFFDAFGIHYHDVYGYTSTTGMAAGWQRGDTQLVYESAATLAPYVHSGIGSGLVLGAKLQSTAGERGELTGIQAWTKLWTQQEGKATPTQKKQFADAELLSTFPQAQFFAPSATPANRFDALRAAVKYAEQSSTAISQLSTIGQPTGYLSYSVQKEQFVDGYPKLPTILRLAGGTTSAP